MLFFVGMTTCERSLPTGRHRRKESEQHDEKQHRQGSDRHSESARIDGSGNAPEKQHGSEKNREEHIAIGSLVGSTCSSEFLSRRFLQAFRFDRFRYLGWSSRFGRSSDSVIALGIDQHSRLHD
jgi:hypothetical protein